MRKSICFLFLSILILAGNAGRLFAQATASGTVQGSVTDSSGAVIAGTEVTITSASSGATRTVMTNDSGAYRFDLLSAGTYKVKVAKTGFSTVEDKVELLVGSTTTANVSMVPGAASSTVEISADNPLVDVTKTSVSTNISPTEVQELPMVGRDVANLAYLAPGVKAADSYDPTKNRYAILSVNGAGGRNVNVTVNGVDNKDNTVGGPVMQLPLEAVQEFQISTQRFSAENGRSEGAAINLITKTGTNKYHGSVFGYFRDTNLDTSEQQADGAGGHVDVQPDYTRQQFGGSVGGPIKQDKLFVFFALEREREHQAFQEQIKSLTELTAAKPYFSGDDPVATLPRPFFETRYNGRMDWTISPKHSAYIAYNSQANNSLNDQSDGTGDKNNGNFTVNHLQLANFTVNSVFSPTLVNTFTSGYQYWNNLIASDISAPLVTFPSASFGTNTNVPQQSFQRKWQFKDDISKTWRNHTFKAGIDYIWNPVEGGFFESNSTLQVDFQADPTDILGDTKTYPDGFQTAGLVASMEYSDGDPYFLVATKQLGLYIQDDWKLTKRLSLNLGLRWDKDFNMIGGSDIKNSRTYQELVAINDPLSNPYVSRIAHDDNKDFSPRVGFAYDLTGKGRQVIRGGFGLYYGNIFQNIPLFMEQMANATVFQQALSITDPTTLVPGTTKTLGEYQYGLDPLPTLPGPSTELADGSVGRLMDPHYRNPITEEFNAGYTWAVNNNTAVEVEYTHVLSLHDNKTINIDQRLPVDGVCCTAPLSAAFAAAGQPVLASVRNEEAIGRAHYDGMFVSFRERMGKRFQVDGNYALAWAYSYGEGGGSFRNYPRVASAPFASYEWGPSPNDERHHVSISGIVNLPKGFEIAPILQYGSSRPYAPTNSVNGINAGGGTLAAVVVPISNPTDYTAYANMQTASENCFYGTGGVAATCTIAKFDPLRGDPFFELDMRLAKNINFGERARVQLVAQAFNLTNRANYGGNFGTSIAAGTFQKPVGFINPDNTTTPRAIWGELGARFTF